MTANYETIAEAGPEAPWIVMVHGMSHDHRVFSAQVDGFRARYRIATIDLPGHGLSAAIGGPFGHGELARHVLGAIDDAGIARCHYWASHTGTALGLLLACAEPARFHSLILEAAVLPGHLMPYVDAALQRAREHAQSAGIAAARKLWFESGEWFEVIRARPVECRAQAHWEIIADFAGAPWLSTEAALPVAPIDDALAALALPVLLYNGEHDVADFAAAADFLEARLPNVKRAVIPGGGGFPGWEFPGLVNRLADDFLAAL